MAKERKYIVRKGKKKIEVTLPAGLTLDTKRVILETIKRIDNEEYLKTALELLNAVVSEIAYIIGFLKEDGMYSPVIEKTMRDIIGENLEIGLRLGISFAGSPEQILSFVQTQIDIDKALAKVPEDKRGVAAYLMYTLSLGSLSLKVGLIIGSLMIADQREKYIKKLGEKPPYYL